MANIISTEQFNKTIRPKIKVISKPVASSYYSEQGQALNENERKSFLEKAGDIFTPLLTTFGRTLAMGDYEKAQESAMQTWQAIGKSMTDNWKSNPNLTKEQKMKRMKLWQDSAPKIIEQHPDFNKTFGQIAGEAMTTGLTMLNLAESVPGIAQGVSGLVGKIPGVGKQLAQLGGREIMPQLAGKAGIQILAIPEGFGAKAIAQRAGISATYGVGYATGTALQKKQNLPEAVKTITTQGITSALVSFGFDLTLLGIKKALEAHPAVAEFFTKKPKEVYERQFERYEETGEKAQLLGKEKFPEKIIVGDLQETEQTMRTMLSDDYDEAIAKISKKYKDTGFPKGVTLTESQQKLLMKIDEMFPTDLPNLPTETTYKVSGNIKNLNLTTGKTAVVSPKLTEPLSPETFISIYKDLNELDRQLIGKPTDAAHLVSKAKNIFKQLGINAYGGPKGEFAGLLSDYSTKVKILNDVNDIANAWKNNPKALSSATNQLFSTFNENKWSYLDAIGKFEQLSGKSFIDEIAVTATKRLMPERIGEFGLGEVMRLIGWPIFSAKPAAGLTRILGKTTAERIPALISNEIIRKLIIPNLK